MSLVREGDFFSRKACYLNPTFGSTHSNADLLIDDRLIEIKTVKNLVLDRRHLHQLVQYYILLSLEGVDVGRKRRIENVLSAPVTRVGEGTGSVLEKPAPRVAAISPVLPVLKPDATRAIPPGQFVDDFRTLMSAVRDRNRPR